MTMNNKANFDTRQPFYGVIADNGLGLYCNEQRLKKTLQYTINSQIIKFDTRLAAERVTIQKYNQLLLEHGCNCGFYKDMTMKLDWFYFRSELSGQIGKIWLVEPDDIVRPIIFE